MTALGALSLAALISGAGFGPFGSEGAPVTRDAEFPKVSAPFVRPTDNPLYLAFDVYRETMTIFDGPRCIHRPVCSVYGVRAVQRHGLLGFFLAIDRLWRGAESSSLRGLPAVWIDGEPYFKDPLSDSDFWLSRKPSRVGSRL